MDVSAPIPIPLTRQDEEEQLRSAIMRSLEDNYRSTEDLRSSLPAENVTPVRSISARTTANQYRRSTTMPNVSSEICSWKLPYVADLFIGQDNVTGYRYCKGDVYQ